MQRERRHSQRAEKKRTDGNSTGEQEREQTDTQEKNRRPVNQGTSYVRLSSGGFIALLTQTQECWQKATHPSPLCCWPRAPVSLAVWVSFLLWAQPKLS